MSQSGDEVDLVDSLKTRLRALEQYKDLCEKRIADLHPQHPFPVKQEHIGVVKPSQEAHHLRQKVARLEYQLAQQQFSSDVEVPEEVTELKKEKAALEESLRSEVITVEEQRSYIEVLKQALEAKITDLGLLMNTEAFIDYTQAKALADEGRRQSAKAQGAIADYETQVIRLRSQLETALQEKEVLMQQVCENDANLQEAAQALKYAEEEVETLEQEKAAALSFLDESEAQKRASQTDLHQTSAQLEIFASENQKLKEDNGRQRALIEKLEASSYSHKTSAERNEAALKDLSSQHLNTSNTLERKEQQLVELSIQTEHLTANKESLTAQLAEVSKRLLDKQEELSDLRKLNAVNLKDKGEIANALERLRNEHALLGQEKDHVTNEVRHTRGQLADTEQSLRDSERQLDSVQGRCRELEAELRRAHDSLSQGSQRERFQAEELSRVETRLSFSQEQNERLQTANKQLEQELSMQHRQRDSLEVELARLEEERAKLLEELSQLQMSLGAERATTKLQSEQIAALREELGNSHNLLAASTDANKNLEALVKRSEQTSHQLKRDIEAALQESDLFAQEKHQCETQLRNLTSELQATETDSRRLADTLDQAWQAANWAFQQVTDTAYCSRSFVDCVRNCTDLGQAIQAAVNEVLHLQVQLHNSVRAADATDSTVTSLQYKVAQLKEERNGLKDREHTLTMQLDSTAAELKAVREDFAVKLETAQQELTNYSEEMHYLQTHTQRLDDALRHSNQEGHSLSSKVVASSQALQQAEAKSSLLSREKAEVENVLSLVQRILPAPELQRVTYELSKTMGDLSRLEHERLRTGDDLHLRADVQSLKQRAEDLKEQLKRSAPRYRYS